MLTAMAAFEYQQAAIKRGHVSDMQRLGERMETLDWKMEAHR